MSEYSDNIGNAVDRGATPIHRRPRINKAKPTAFELDSKIKLNLDFNLAVELGDLILGSQTPNQALLAMGHQLKNLESDI